MPIAPKTDGRGSDGRTTPFTIVVLAASAGGLDAITSVIERLPATFPIPVAVVLHRSGQLPNMLPDILSRRTGLRVRLVKAGEKVEAGVVYIAAPTLHLTIDAGRRFVCTDGAMVNYVHSSADPLLRSAAEVYRDGAIAVVLSGSGRDGAEGARAVALAGGHVLVQDQATSQAFGMPGAAISTGEVDAVLPVDQIGPELVRLASIGRPGHKAR
jgi:two-component system chemotaxis response regulator CheB